MEHGIFGISVPYAGCGFTEMELLLIDDITDVMMARYIAYIG